MYTVLKDVIIRTGATTVTSDIEGGLLADVNARQVRNNVMKRLKTDYPNMKFGLTLPTLTNGLDYLGMNIVKNVIDTDTPLDYVNIMSFDFNSKDSLNGITNSAVGLFSQLKSFFPTKTDSQIYAMMGITMMIGSDDQSMITDIDTFRKICQWAEDRKIYMISYWALQRDQVNTKNINDLSVYSMQNKSDYEYFNAAKTILSDMGTGTNPNGSGPSTPATGTNPVVTPDPTNDNPSSDNGLNNNPNSSNIPIESDVHLEQGAILTLNGIAYTIFSGVIKGLNYTAPVESGSQPDTTPLPTSTVQWALNLFITANQLVSYNGKLYRALVSHTVYSSSWTPNSVPSLYQAIQ